MYRYLSYMLLAGFQFILICTKAQQPYSIIHYDESALPQTTIGNIQQSKNGYLWMNTQFGIVRFDGETFRVFTTDNLKGLTSNRIRTCATSWDGSIYLVDEANIIVKVKSPNQFETMSPQDCFRELKLPLYSRESNNDFAYLEFDTQSSYNEFVDSMKFDLTREFFKSYVTGEKKGYLFYADLQQRVRLCYYNGNNYTSTIQSDSFKAQHTFKLANRVFIQTGLRQAILFDKEGQQQQVPVTGLPADLPPVFNRESAVLFSNASGTFFYSSGRLFQYKFKGDHVEATLIFKDLPCIGVVNVMTETSTGDFLISTRSTGFFRVKKKRFSVVNLTAPITPAPGQARDFNNNIVYSLTLWDKQHLFFNGYITPFSGGISRDFDPSNKSSLDYFFTYSKDSLHFLMNMGDGSKSSLQNFNKQNGSYTPLFTMYAPKKVLELSDGTSILIAARSITAVQGNKVTELNKNEGAEFTTAEKVTDDCLLLGTMNGLYYFYPRTQTLRAIKYKDALNVRFIFKDKSGKFWFTTYGQGLFHLSGDSIIPLPLDNARHLAISHSIVEDRSGHFWVPTNHGLFKLGYASLLSIIRRQGSKLYYTYYDKTDGFNTNEFNGGCFPSNIYQPETGQVFFPSMNGVVRFNADSLPDVTNNSAVFFDEIVMNDTGHIYSVSGRTVFAKQTASIRIDFSSPYYGHTENVKYSYNLSDDPKEWKDLPKSRSITFNNLPGGSYTLVIKKEGGTSAPIEASFQFDIQRKFSETVVFKLLLLILVVALVYLYFRARIYYLNKERKRLEQIVAIKTADQLQLIDQLRDNIAHLTQLQQQLEQMMEHKENILAVLIHDIKSPLHFLNTVAEHLYKGINLNPPQKNRDIAHEISVSINRLYLFTQDFAIWLNASQPGHIQKRELVDLDKIVEEALAVYKEIIDKKDIKILTRISCKFVYGDEPMIKSVIRNLVDNAIKNTPKGNIIITGDFAPNEERCELIIADEGKGMSEEQIVAINKYFRAGDDVLLFSTLGYGHKVIKDFVHKMRGTISYRQNFPSGVIAIISLPVTSSPLNTILKHSAATI
ncbi:MAG: ATP-binding protein [Ferruginibacter sp.]